MHVLHEVKQRQKKPLVFAAFYKVLVYPRKQPVKDYDVKIWCTNKQNEKIKRYWNRERIY